MTKVNLFAAAVLATGLLLGSQSAQAHCDALDGPVAAAAQKALDSGNVNLALPYAPAKAEAEIKAAFAHSAKVRPLGPDAKALADRAFIETIVRLHREGEGAAYTGLKPAGADHGPAIPAAERALATGNAAPLEALLVEEIEHGLHARLEEVRKARKAGPKDVAAARHLVSAELGFVVFAETLRQAAHGEHGHKE